MADHVTRIGFIGGGRVARILVGGWLHGGGLPGALSVTEPDDAAFEQLVRLAPDATRASIEDTASADLVLLALHPPGLAPVLPALRPHLHPEAIVLSLAPKVTLDELAQGLGTRRVARLIPNAPSIIGRGYNPVAFGAGLDDGAREMVRALAAPWGESPEVEERELEAFALVSGMGPTYFWFQWQLLRELGREFGLSEARADEALRRTIEGALATLLDAPLTPGEVMDLVPVRPLQAIEPPVAGAYRDTLPALLARLRPAAASGAAAKP
jgi:pyrroline-5-carboxylate reductase